MAEGDVQVPVIGKTKPKTLVIGGLVVAGVIAYFVYKHASTTQQQNMGKAAGTGMKRGNLVNGVSKSRTHYRWEWAT